MRSSLCESFNTFASPSVPSLHQHDVIDPHLASNERLRRVANNFKHQKIRVWPGFKSSFLYAPRGRAQRVVGEHVRGVGVSIDNSEARTAGRVDGLCPRLGT